MLLVIFFAIGIHEYAHAKFADMAGDPTPGIYGRVTLNLIKHFDPIGTIMIIFTSLVGVGIGWGRPVPMDPRKMRNPKWDHFSAVAAGPISNIVQATLWALFGRFLLAAVPGMGAAVGAAAMRMTTDVDPVALFLGALVFFGVVINISLCVFNLLPIGPLDGMWLLGTFMPEKSRWAWTKFNLTTGTFLFLGLVLFSQLSNVSLLSAVIGPPIAFMSRFLLGF